MRERKIYFSSVNNLQFKLRGAKRTVQVQMFCRRVAVRGWEAVSSPAIYSSTQLSAHHRSFVPASRPLIGQLRVTWPLGPGLWLVAVTNDINRVCDKWAHLILAQVSRLLMMSTLNLNNSCIFRFKYRQESKEINVWHLGGWRRNTFSLFIYWF